MYVKVEDAVVKLLAIREELVDNHIRVRGNTLGDIEALIHFLVKSEPASMTCKGCIHISDMTAEGCKKCEECENHSNYTIPKVSW